MTHLQSVLLMILTDVDKLLRDNGIPYFLGGGSALGAVRHKGFIPWDDDLDLIILPEDYDKFVEVCRTKLDKSKYTFQEAEKDWPLPFSKIKLNGTSIDEVDAFPTDNKGIYIDIACFDYARKTSVGKFIQFLFGRLYLACVLSEKPYTTDSIIKKLAIQVAKLVKKNHSLFRFIRNQARGIKKTEEFASVWDRTRSNWTKYFCPKSVFDSAVLMEFEGKKFPVSSNYHQHLSNLYGDYMKLPPEEKRVGLHIKDIDFGKY